MLEDVKLVEHIEEGKGILTQNRVCLVYPFPLLNLNFVLRQSDS